VNEVIGALQRLSHRKIKVVAPCWLDGGEGKPAPRDVVIVENGLLDITTGKIFSKHTPNFYSFTALPVKYDRNAKCLRFDQFIDEIGNGQEDFRRNIAMMLGLLLTADTSYQVIFHFHGESRGGKGTLNRVIEALLGGTANIASPSMRSIAGQYGLMETQTKTLLVFSDSDQHDKKILLTAASIFNRISGEDTVRVERKYKSPIDIRLPVRLLLIGNRLPDFGEYAVAIMNRLRTFDFQRSFIGKEDPDLTAKLIAELPGILNFAIEGLRELRKLKRFPETDASLALKTKMLKLANPLRGFVEDRCVLEADASESKETIFYEYNLYCQTMGAHYIKSLQEIGIELPKLCHGVDEKRARLDNGKREWHFTGIRLRTAQDDAAEDKAEGIEPPDEDGFLEPLPRKPRKPLDVVEVGDEVLDEGTRLRLMALRMAINEAPGDSAERHVARAQRIMSRIGGWQ
jgi:putative DNA primase/helicase